jgi:hypothetical protein
MAGIQPEESALELFAWRGRRAVDCGVRIIDALAPDGLSAGDVVEICGQSGAGKSILLSTIAARLATSELRGGPAVDVAYLDLDGRVPLHRLNKCVTHQLALHAGVDPSEEEVKDALSRISGHWCADTLQLCASLLGLRLEAGARAPGRLLAVLVDGLGSSAWIDKFELRYKSGQHSSDNAASAILSLTRSRRALAVVASTLLFESKEGACPMIHRQARVRVHANCTNSGPRVQLTATANQPAGGGSASTGKAVVSVRSSVTIQGDGELVEVLHNERR